MPQGPQPGLKAVVSLLGQKEHPPNVPELRHIETYWAQTKKIVRK